jgi:hypothetical protein
VQDLDREQRSAQGGAKDRGDAGGHARDKQHSSLAHGGAEQAAQQRADGAPHLHRGSFTTARAAEAERQDRSNELGRRDAPANRAPSGMEGFDRGVCPAAQRVGGVTMCDQAREQRANGGAHEQDPEPDWTGGLRTELARRAQRSVARGDAEHEMLDIFDAGDEQRTHQPGCSADERRVQQHAPQDLQVELRGAARDRSVDGGQSPGAGVSVARLLGGAGSSSGMRAQHSREPGSRHRTNAPVTVARS